MSVPDPKRTASRSVPLSKHTYLCLAWSSVKRLIELLRRCNVLVENVVKPSLMNEDLCLSTYTCRIVVIMACTVPMVRHVTPLLIAVSERRPLPWCSCASEIFGLHVG